MHEKGLLRARGPHKKRSDRMRVFRIAEVVLLVSSILSACNGDSTDELDSAEIQCFQGWSNSSGCCLSDTVVEAVDECPQGYFAESECDRLDQMCEGIDLGQLDASDLDIADSDVSEDAEPEEVESADGPSCDDDTSEQVCYQGWSGSNECCLSGEYVCSPTLECPEGTFTESECTRFDPVCESIDVGGPDN